MASKPLDRTRDSQPITTFRAHAADIVRHLKDSQRPLTLTQRGRPAAVVQDADAYRRLLDLAAEANAAEGIRRGLEDMRQGRTHPARDVFDGLRNRRGIPR